MSSAIQNTLHAALGDGARATKYDVAFVFVDPNPQVTNEDLMVMGKSSTFPGKSHVVVDFKYKGRSIPIRGMTKFTQTWDCTFVLTEDHALKNAMENWIEGLDQVHNYVDVSSNAHVQDIQRAHSYTTDVLISQRNYDDTNNTAEYTLFNAFPIEVSPVQVTYSSVGEVLEFTVTFAYSHFQSQVIKSSQGNFVDNLIGKLGSSLTTGIQGAAKTIGNTLGAYLLSDVPLGTAMLNNSTPTAHTQTSGASMQDNGTPTLFDWVN